MEKEKTYFRGMEFEASPTTVMGRCSPSTVFIMNLEITGILLNIRKMSGR